MRICYGETVMEQYDTGGLLILVATEDRRKKRFTNYSIGVILLIS